MRAHRKWIRLSLVVAGAALVGVVAAFAAAGHGYATAKPLYATNHCTRYNPSTSVDQLCQVNGSTDAVACTNGVAQRDQNIISLPGSSTNWTLLYFSDHCWGSSPKGKTGFGSGGTLGPQTGYTYAACEYSAQTGLYGNCTTNWHS
jgi:hypothetical protein